MILSSKENVKPEQKLNSEPEPSIIPPAPAIGNTNAVRSCFLLIFALSTLKFFYLQYLRAVGQRLMCPADSLPCFLLTRLTKAGMPETQCVPWSRPCRGITGDQHIMTAWKDTHFFLSIYCQLYCVVLE